MMAMQKGRTSSLPVTHTSTHTLTLTRTIGHVAVVAPGGGGAFATPPSPPWRKADGKAPEKNPF